VKRRSIVWSTTYPSIKNKKYIFEEGYDNVGIAGKDYCKKTIVCDVTKVQNHSSLIIHRSLVILYFFKGVLQAVRVDLLKSKIKKNLPEKIEEYLI